MAWILFAKVIGCAVVAFFGYCVIDEIGIWLKLRKYKKGTKTMTLREGYYYVCKSCNGIGKTTQSRQEGPRIVYDTNMCFSCLGSGQKWEEPHIYSRWIID